MSQETNVRIHDKEPFAKKMDQVTNKNPTSQTRQEKIVFKLRLTVVLLMYSGDQHLAAVSYHGAVVSAPVGVGSAENPGCISDGSNNVTRPLYVSFVYVELLFNDQYLTVPNITLTTEMQKQS